MVTAYIIVLTYAGDGSGFRVRAYLAVGMSGKWQEAAADYNAKSPVSFRKKASPE